MGFHDLMRSLALSLLVDIETRGTYANLALAKLPQNLSSLDRALVTELVNGATRMRRALDFQLDRILDRPLSTLKPAIRNNLRLGAYQILYLTRIPAHAAVHESVALARKRGHEGVAKLTNAVLRELVRRHSAGSVEWPQDPLAKLAVRRSYPDWLIERWIAAYGLEEADRLAAAQDQPPPFAIRTNLLRLNRDDLLRRLQAADVAAEPSSIAPEGIRLADPGALPALPGFEQGWWCVQGEAAMLVAAALDPRPGEVVADVGAAPGGKATHLAERMKNTGSVLAIESHPGRLALVEQNARRLGITTVVPLERDARQILEVALDAALVDAPCSGLGTLYRKADLRWRASPEQIPELIRLQLQILSAVAASIKPGGRMVYSTCTIGSEENEDVARAFLARHPEFLPGDLSSALPQTLRPEAGRGWVQMLPQRHGTEGFFIARFDRKI
ncbi:MAG: 16S rRNA (cytosine(967)-C(5))-methyltransferase RsmB [Cyanobacteria bacterium REEB65]|nr:16S rRNA (cytosine(967)-C(5))-methyltransferase RsmB [Cyanobacteria bacterium REEB65]